MKSEEIKVIISNGAFPSDDFSDSEKANESYGLSVGKSIEGEWFKKSGSSCRYYSRYQQFYDLRLYARGEQPIAKYKNELAIDGDLSYMNLDWSIVPIIPKFVDIVVNGMNDRMYAVKAESQDVMSAEKKNLFQDMLEADMVAKDFLIQTKEQFGIDAFNTDPNDLPDTPEELSLYMQLKYKPSIEIAEEIALNTLLEINDYKDIVKPRVDRDVTVIGIGAVKHHFNRHDGIRIDYVDPADLVYSYTEKPDFSDCYYFGEVKAMHYTEIYKIKPSITTEEMTKIKSHGGAWYDYYTVARDFNDDLSSGELIPLLYFTYKTTKNDVFKKKKLKNGGEKVIKKDDLFNPEPSEDFEKLSMKREVWYEGIMVLGSNILLRWEMAKNMIRPKSATQRVMPSYICVAPNMYKGVIESLTRRMIPFADQIQLTHLKLQQIKSRIVPDGVFIDADGLNEVDLGNGGEYSPQDALQLYFQTGSVVGRSYTAEGEFNNAKVPIQELQHSSGQSKMMALINDYNHQLNMLRDVTGLNEARDASNPDPNALVGVQKLAALNSNTATRHILRSGLLVTKKLCQGLSLRISDVLEYADFRNEFAMQIGKYNLSILDDIKDLYLHSFGVFIELEPDEEEKAQLEANIQMALQREQIDLSDAIDIRTIKNLKYANEMLKIKKKKRDEARIKEEQSKMQMQAQINSQSQQMAAQIAIQKAQTEGQVKMSIKQAEIDGEIAKMMKEAELKRELMDIEFQYNMQLKGVEVSGIMTREKEKEKAKDDRVNKEATAQSRLIEQRQKDLPAINFESNEDSLDGFSFEEFNAK